MESLWYTSVCWKHVCPLTCPQVHRISSQYNSIIIFQYFLVASNVNINRSFQLRKKKSAKHNKRWLKWENILTPCCEYSHRRNVQIHWLLVDFPSKPLCFTAFFSTIFLASSIFCVFFKSHVKILFQIYTYVIMNKNLKLTFIYSLKLYCTCLHIKKCIKCKI